MNFQPALQATEGWGRTETLTIIGIVVAVLAVFVTIWIDRKARPKRRMKYTFKSIPLLADHAWTQHASVELRVDKEIVKNPHVVTIALWSASRADISSNHFNANKPLAFEMDSEALYDSNISSKARNGQELNFRRDGKTVFVDPCLIKPKDRVQASYIFDGNPKMVVKSQLIDINLDESETPTLNRSEKLHLIVAFNALAIAIFTLIVMSVQLYVAFSYAGQ